MITPGQTSSPPRSAKRTTSKKKNLSVKKSISTKKPDSKTDSAVKNRQEALAIGKEHRAGVTTLRKLMAGGPRSLRRHALSEIKSLQSAGVFNGEERSALSMVAELLSDVTKSNAKSKLLEIRQQLLAASRNAKFKPNALAILSIAEDSLSTAITSSGRPSRSGVTTRINPTPVAPPPPQDPWWEDALEDFIGAIEGARFAQRLGLTGSLALKAILLNAITFSAL
jgi:hypothetical protein